MAIESKREKIVYYGVFPIAAAIVGALATAIFQAANAPDFHLPNAMAVIKDTSLTSAEKIKLIEMIKDVGDRPWSVIRSLATSFTFLVAVCAIPLTQRISNR